MRKPGLMIIIVLLLLLIGGITTLAVHLKQSDTATTAGQGITKTEPDFFPLHYGNYWEYSFHSREAIGSNEISSQDQIIRMEVLSTREVGEYQLAEMVGDPIYFHPQGHFGLAMHNKTGKFYYLDDNLLQRLLIDLKKKTFKPDTIADLGTILFEFPLRDGQTYGSQGVPRQDTMYMYAVTSNGSYQGAVAKSDRPLPLYQIRYACIADVITYDFVPGLGIIRSNYHHNGTVIDYDVKLTACQVK